MKKLKITFAIVYKKLSQNLRDALGKTILGSVVILLMYQFPQLNFVRVPLDQSFDKLNQLYLYRENTPTQSPNVFIYEVDDFYLKKKNLLDRYGELNFGYIFPRNKLTEMIEHFDDLNPDNQPKVLFLDFDISYTSMPDGRSLHTYDIKFLDTLARDRNYTIVLTHNNRRNIVYDFGNDKLHRLVEEGKIILASTKVMLDNDNIIRRYQSYDGTEKKYYSAPILMWAMYQNDINLSKFKYEDFIQNKIIFKKFDGNASAPTGKNSLWQNLVIYSTYSFDLGYKDDLKNAIVMIGSAHGHTQDKYEVNSFLQQYEMYGIEILANQLMTLFYFHGTLHQLPLLLVLLIVSLTFFLVAYGVDEMMDRYYVYGEVGKEFFKFLLQLSILVLIFGIISLYFVHKGIWFAWVLPLVVFELIDLIASLITIYTLWKELKKSLFANVLAKVFIFRELYRRVNTKIFKRKNSDG